MQVHKLDATQSRDVRRFVAFPFELYRECPHWVPPLRADAHSTLQRDKHPFYAHSTADFFIVESGGATLGRIAALENRHFNQHQGRRAAFFGYFEVVEDQAAAAALFEAALTWARQRGLNEIIGPRGVIGIDGSVLVEGFDQRPALGIPYNFPYYDQFIRAAGFAPDADYLSGYLSGKHELPERFYRIAETVKRRRGFWIKTFTSQREIHSWIPRALEVHRQAMSQLHTFYPPTEAETSMVINTLLKVVNPHLVKLVMQGEEIVGFILAYQDVSAALQKARGRLWPFGWYHILREQRATKWLNINGLGLLPSHRGLGANTLLYTELEKTVKTFGFEHIDVVQVNADNFNSRADMENIGVRWYKRHRHYRRTV
jgi:GNAT superfamily N-acetyltransferase